MTSVVLTRIHAWRAVVFVGAVGLFVALSFDRWYEGERIAREKDRVQELVAPYTNQLLGFFDRRVSRLDALRAFVEAAASMRQLDVDFPTYAQGLMAGAPGVRAFQLVRDARIVRTWPARDASVLEGLNLLEHPAPEVVSGVRKSMQSDGLVLSGPFPLVQGGDGLTLRQRIRPSPPGGPDMVGMVIDLPAVLEEAGLSELPESIAFILTNHRGQTVVARGTPRDAEVTRLRIADVVWTLRVAPAAGWRGAVAEQMRFTRAGSVLLWFMLLYVTASVIGRQRALTHAVEARTQELVKANDELRREAAERRALEEQLLHSQKMEAVGTLAGGIAHDFNNLLTAITGFAQLADQLTESLQDAGQDAAQREPLQRVRVDLGEILKASERASLLTSQLLAFSHRQKVTPDRHDVNVVVHDLERMMHRLIGERVSLDTALAETPLYVLIDAGQLSQVLMNLVVNARDALPGDGHVRIATSALNVADERSSPFAGLGEGEWVVIRVTDDGVGMPPEILARIFEPFFTTKQMGQGTGLGLSMVYGIVTQAGGRVFAESTPGRGTSVSIVLPRITEPASAPLTLRATAPQAAGEVVLVVEDEAGLRRLVADVLQRKGFRVLVAPDGLEALRLLAEQEALPDLVLTDVVMPRMGGRELAREIEKRGFGMPVLFMSGYQDVDDMPDEPRYSYIAKPFTPTALVEKVRRAIGASG